MSTAITGQISMWAMIFMKKTTYTSIKNGKFKEDLEDRMGHISLSSMGSWHCRHQQWRASGYLCHWYVAIRRRKAQTHYLFWKQWFVQPQIGQRLLLSIHPKHTATQQWWWPFYRYSQYGGYWSIWLELGCTYLWRRQWRLAGFTGL